MARNVHDAYGIAFDIRNGCDSEGRMNAHAIGFFPNRDGSNKRTIIQVNDADVIALFVSTTALLP